jgi:hypothetical protein
LLFEPARVGVHRGLEVGLVAMAVAAEGRVEVGVAESLRRGVDAGDAPELGGEGVAGEVHVEAVRDIAADEPCGLQLAVLSETSSAADA